MSEKPKLILDPNQLEAEFEQQTSNNKSLHVKFEEVVLGNTGCVLKHAITDMGDTSNITLIANNADDRVMMDISVKLRTLVENLNLRGSEASAGVSPKYRHQWEFMLFHVPTFRVVEIRRFFVKELMSLFSS